MFRRILGHLLIAVVAVVSAQGAAANAPVTASEPEAVYGDGIDFSILRDGNRVGSHSLRFERAGNDLVVHARSDIAVKVFGFTVYSFAYRSRGVWRDGELQSLDATQTENGKEQAVVARRENGVMRVTGPGGERNGPAGVFPTNHWHPGVLDADVVLNTLTGNLDAIAVRRLEGDDATPHRFEYSGGFEAEVWYDRYWRWTRLRFAARDGSAIDYVCTSCAEFAVGSTP